MNLRGYQTEAVETAVAQWATGARSTLFVCPTGGGKTLVFAEIVRRHLEGGGRRALIIADRNWLVTQARDAVESHSGFEARVEMAELRVSRDSLPAVVCASVQSLARRLEQFATDSFDLIVIDEADLALAPSYWRVVKHFVDAKIFGCTATPERGDGAALGDFFEMICGDVDIRDLIDVDYLCAVRQHTVKVLDLSRVRMGENDLDEASLEQILTEERHLHEVVKPTMELAGDRPTLVFGTTVRHAELLAALFNRYQPGSARSVHGKIKRSAQHQLIRGFVAREFQFLCNCNLIMRGVDIPSISCVAMARPTQSRTIYVQGIGRGTRLSKGKTDLLVLDFTDAAASFSLVNSIDVLGGRATEEERERAREIVDDNPGADVSTALAQARDDLKNATVRARVLAKVKFRLRSIEIKDPIDWNAQPLGIESDKSIAKQLGIAPGTVARQRTMRGIPAFSLPVINWDSLPLGKMTDRDIARKILGDVKKTAAVQMARTNRSVPKYIPSGIDWAKQPLGKIEDRILAERLGVSVPAVCAARKKRGIKVFCRFPVDWTDQPLGVVPDSILAKRLGVPKSTVGYHRKRLGIKSCPRSEIDRKGLQHLVATLSSKEIAEKAGMKISAVQHYKRERGIKKSLEREPKDEM